MNTNDLKYWQVIGLLIICFLGCLVALIISEINEEAIKYELIGERSEKQMWLNRYEREKTAYTMEEIVRAVWRENAKIGIAIAKCESNLNPKAKNLHSSASGLFQILKEHWYYGFDPFNPYQNTALAYRLFKQNGTSDWLSSRNCWDRNKKKAIWNGHLSEDRKK